MTFDFHFFWSPRHAKWIILGLISLFVLLILVESVTLFTLSVSPSEGSSSVEVESGKTKEDAFQYLLTSSLFGEYYPKDLGAAYVKKSMLNVTLVGILYAEPLENSQVIIRSASGDEITYKIGDKLPGGAVIKRIMSDGILVAREGLLESLSLPKMDLNFEPVSEPLKGEGDS